MAEADEQTKRPRSPATRRESNRRSGPDLLVGSLIWLSAAGWLIIASAFVYFDDAAPPELMGLYELTRQEARKTWDASRLRIALYLAVMAFVVSAIGLVANAMRHRRETDSYRWSLLVLSAISLAGIIVISLHPG